MNDIEQRLIRVEEQINATREDVKEVKEAVDFLTRQFVQLGFRYPPPGQEFPAEVGVY